MRPLELTLVLVNLLAFAVLVIALFRPIKMLSSRCTNLTA